MGTRLKFYDERETKSVATSHTRGQKQLGTSSHFYEEGGTELLSQRGQEQLGIRSHFYEEGGTEQLSQRGEEQLGIRSHFYEEGETE